MISTQDKQIPPVELVTFNSHVRLQSPEEGHIAACEYKKYPSQQM